MDIVKENFFASVCDFKVDKSKKNNQTLAEAIYMDEVWDVMRKNWHSPNTRKQYLSQFNRYIFPYMDKPLKECTLEDCDRVIANYIDALKKAGKRIEDEKTRHIRYILGKAISASAQMGICDDFLWGTAYGLNEENYQQICEAEFVRLPKSLSVEQEVRLCKYLLDDPEQEGELFGVALMFCLGVRENEACAITFEDFKPIGPDKSIYFVYITKSSHKNTRKVKASGKTKNAVRAIYVPSVLMKLIKQREAYVRKQGFKGIHQSHPERCPVACHGNKYNERCKPSEISATGTALLRQISQELDSQGNGGDLKYQMMYIDNMLRSGEFTAQLRSGQIEKNPTAYLLRRNFATHLYLLGLSKNEIQYIMGHDITDNNDTRNYFSNEEKLLELAQKLSKRPLVNDESTDVKKLDGSLSEKDVDYVKVKITESGKYHIDIKQLEPHSHTKLYLKKEGNATVSGNYFICENDNLYSWEISSQKFYLKRYKDEIAERDEVDK